MANLDGELPSQAFKVLVIGDPGTGKSSIIRRFVHNIFTSNYKATIGVDFASKIVVLDANRVVHLQLWDISGQDRYGVMTRVYYKDAQGAVVVCDSSRQLTADGAKKWKADLDEKVTLSNGSPIPAILLANKCDIEEGMDERQVQKLKGENGFADAFLVSAKKNIGIDAAFNQLIENILKTEREGQYEMPPFRREDVRRLDEAVTQKRRSYQSGCC